MADDILECLIDVRRVKRRRFDEYEVIVCSKLPTSPALYHPQMLQIGFVAHQYYRQLIFRVLLQFGDPFVQVLKRSAFGDVVHQHGAHCAAIVRTGNGAVTFLTWEMNGWIELRDMVVRTRPFSLTWIKSKLHCVALFLTRGGFPTKPLAIIWLESTWWHILNYLIVKLWFRRDVLRLCYLSGHQSAVFRGPKTTFSQPFEERNVYVR